MRPRDSFTESAVPLLVAGGLVLSLLVGPWVDSLCAAPNESGDSVLDWLNRMEAHFESNPHLKEMGGSGWKPYNRVKWFVEQRLVDGVLPPPARSW